MLRPIYPHTLCHNNIALVIGAEARGELGSRAALLVALLPVGEGTGQHWALSEAHRGRQAGLAAATSSLCKLRFPGCCFLRVGRAACLCARSWHRASMAVPPCGWLSGLSAQTTSFPLRLCLLLLLLHWCTQKKRVPRKGLCWSSSHTGWFSRVPQGASPRKPHSFPAKP